MYDAVPSIIFPTANMKSWSGTQIDSLDNLSSRRIFMQVGTADTTVGLNVMHQLDSQLSGFYNGANVQFVATIGAVHTFPTDFDGVGDNLCTESISPFISNCAYDGAGAVLQWLYGSLNPRNTGKLTGTVVTFDQTGAFGASGMDSTGYLYVPAACQSLATLCRLHVAIHGCLQSHSLIGTKYIDNTGYTMWAGEHK